MRNRTLFALVGLLALSAVVPAFQRPPVAAPRAAGMDTATLAKAVDLYRAAVTRDDIRGAVLYVARGGQVVLHEAVGWRHHAYRLPMEKNTLFRMASNTKPVVAAAVLMLADEGKLSAGDPVARHLKSFGNDKSRNVTIAQLLTHSSGFRFAPILLPFADGEERTLQAAAARFGTQGPAAEPGAYSYNNAGYNTLGAVIEVVSGQPLEAFLKSRIYDPLGMVDSLNHEDPAKLQRMATVYRGQHRPDGTVVFTQGFTPGDPPDFPVIRASGGLISTAADYARFLEMYRLGGALQGRRLLGVESARAAVEPRVKIDDSSSYGYGWMIRADGSYSHAGSDGTMAWIDPAREIVGMVLTQSPGGTNPTAQFRTLIEQSVAPAVAVPPPAATPAALPDSIKWVQQSAEYMALTVQTYRIATAHVESAVRSRAAGTWAVVLDADDTVINNLPYQVGLAQEGVKHSPARFTAWVRRRASTPVPGAAKFLARVRELGGRIAVVTNRLPIECDDTAEVLRMNALPFDAVLCRPEGADSNTPKTPRFRAIAAGQTAASRTPIEIVAFVGDNIIDFPDGTQAMRGRGEPAFSEFGARFFLLPNPMYGSWQ